MISYIYFFKINIDLSTSNFVTWINLFSPVNYRGHLAFWEFNIRGFLLKKKKKKPTSNDLWNVVICNFLN